MGPYYRGTSHGMGAFVEMFYEYPILIFVLVAVVGAAGFFIWRRKKSAE
jgi:LPXTG-motif cell wall-anchored protein